MKIENILRWFESEKKKDEKELSNFKNKTIVEIKGLTKQELFNKKPKKISLWARLRKTLMGY